MDTNRLKRFAQTARKKLLEAVADKLKFAIGENSPARRGTPRAVVELEKNIREKGEAAVIDFVAYTWFNRFCALRYMDVMGYNPVRVVSPLPGHFQPEILEEAKGNSFSDEIPAATRMMIRDILASERPNAQLEVYKLLLVAICNAYNKPMPFLFQPINDYTELLMPDDLLSGSSILALTREAILPEVAEKGVEVIGWLYQFYISEKKDEVMGKTVKTEDIPAATQLFTPDWIVRYLVENSLGRLWMLNHPASRLAESMEYYIPATEQDADFLKVMSPEELKVCDPCCGSGHMLTYAFDLLARIYEEAGFSPREIPSLILKNNLHGIEIDPRAGELAAFALTMKAREHDSRFLRRENAPQPNICVLQNVTFDDEEFKSYMDFIGRDLFTAALQTTLRQFEKADCFGSLIVPQLADSAAVLAELESRDVSGQLFLTNIHQKVLAVIRQAEYLSPHYHVVVTNPPYMGSKGMNADLKKFAETKYSDSKSDLFAMFIERCLELVQKHGTIGMITMQSWMFLSSFEKLRTKLLDEDTILSMAHLGPRGFDTIGGEVVQTTAFTLTNTHIPDYQGAFLRLIDGNSEAEKSAMFKEAITI
ncbi:BREX-1 system adenine-specific DNA-methyltransferase PglX [bacterium]|nr:BREX-1 system adenine-specific DNA-methyltransferase PglX [bacterium]